MRKKQIAIIGLVVFIASSMVTFNSMGKTQEEITGNGGIGITEEEVGMMCLETVFPTITRGAERVPITNSEADSESAKEEPEALSMEEATVTPPGIVDTQTPESPDPATVNVDYDKPLVIIYHTHATESYQPYSDGNFHIQSEEGSIREVGNVLAEELLKQGIQTIHDKTMHDVPSYSQSYDRSLETAKALMNQYPTAVFVVDLHRDAASYTGNVGKTAIVNGETAALYSLVVGQGNPNVNALSIYANKINAKAEEMFPGFGGRVIQKAYKFNQYISDYHVLLEIGNNENNIKEARTTAKYFAQVLAGVIKEIKE